MTVDWRRFGLGDAALTRASLDARLDAAGAEVAAALAADGELIAGYARPRLALPPDFGALLERALRLEEAEQAPGWEARVETLLTHYLDLMPAMRTRQVATSAEPNATLFHTPLDPARLPRLRAGLDGLFALVAGAGVAPSRVFGVADVDGLFASRPTLADLYARTYFAGAMPILYGFPADLAAARAELDRGDDAHAVIDRRFAAPLVHELSHLHRDRVPLSPPYLDECVAGHLGVLALPELEIPATGEDNALYMAPWFAHTGRTVARVVGRDALIRAHAGAVLWAEVLPGGLGDAWDALGWEDYTSRRGVHFLGDPFDPEPWLKALFLAAAGALPETPGRAALAVIPWAAVPIGPPDAADVDLLAAALRAACLRPSLEGGAYRVRRARARGPVVVDLEACVVRVDAPPDPLEPVPLSLLAPPALAAALRHRGHRTLRVPAFDADEAAAVAAEIARA